MLALCLHLFLFLNQNFIHGEIKYFGVKHGDPSSTQNEGLCSQFKELNEIACCADRDDECFMFHFDTKCYCDAFCERLDSDCCPDAIQSCQGNYSTTPWPKTTTTTQSSQTSRRTSTTTTTISTSKRTTLSTTTKTTTIIVPPIIDNNECFKNGRIYANGEIAMDNCNTLICRNGELESVDGGKIKTCLINVELMRRVNDVNSGWIASNYSKFWGKPLSYGYENRLGARLNPSIQRPFDPYNGYPLDQRKKPPMAYDYRDFLSEKNLVSRPIRDQGDCSASWAFSTVDVATDRLSKVTDGKYGNQSYSVQMLISCAILKNNANGCTPSAPNYAWNHLIHYRDDAGVVSEECYPYTNENSGMANECKTHSIDIKKSQVTCPSNGLPYESKTLLASPVYPLKVENDEDIMREIMDQGPVQAIFKVYPDFFMYKSGVYKPLDEQSIPDEYTDISYHAVKILGWGTSDNGQNYWLCANSYGSDWGERGYFRIERGASQINNHIYAAWGHGKLKNGRYIYNALKFKSIIQSMYNKVY